MGTKAIIHLDHFLHNFRAVQARIGQERCICVPVKANGYGHGALEIARASVEAGAFYLGVATVGEGTELRKGGIKAPILLFSQPHPADIPEILESDLSPFISDGDFAGILDKEAAAAGKKVKIHLKIDTGMGRIGCTVGDAPGLARHIAAKASLEYTGTATHLAVSDSSSKDDIDYTRQQLANFREALNEIRSAGLNPGIIHAANSGGVILHSDSWFDMVRPGILLYGYKAAEEADASGNIDQKLVTQPINAKPVMELQTQVVFIKKVKKGQSISYGRTWIADRDTTIASLPVGYADGLPRRLSNKWQIVIGCKTYPLVGRICMDQCLADLGPGSEVQRWETAVIFGGPAPDAGILAAAAGTIPYEITCAINKRVPRVCVK